MHTTVYSSLSIVWAFRMPEELVLRMPGIHNERPVNIALLTGYQISILPGARTFQASSGFIKQNVIFEGSQE
jgi:hypothetical protein